MFTWETGDYWVTRLVFQRALGIVYPIAFICALNQFVPLVGEHCLLPVGGLLRQTNFRETPNLFFLAPKDWAFMSAAWVGIILSCLVVVGFADRFSSLQLSQVRLLSRSHCDLSPKNYEAVNVAYRALLECLLRSGLGSLPSAIN